MHVVVTLAVVLSAFTGSLRAQAGTPETCTNSWRADAFGNFNGSWFDPAHWSSGRVPTQEDDVCIDTTWINYTVTVYKYDARAKSLRLGNLTSNGPIVRIGDGVGGALKADGRVEIAPHATIVVIGSCFGGLLGAAGGIESSGTLSTSSNFSWCPWGPPAVVDTGTSALHNQGTLDVWADTNVGVVRNDARVRLSGAITLKVNGDYLQSATGTLAVTYRKPTTGIQQPPSAGGFSLLKVAGNADLAGSLEVVHNGFAPAVGATFPVVSAATRTCAWSHVNGAVIAGTTYYRPECPSSGESLSVRTASLSPQVTSNEPGTSVRVIGNGWPVGAVLEVSMNDFRDLHNGRFSVTVSPSPSTDATGWLRETIALPFNRPPNGLRVRSGAFYWLATSPLITGLRAEVVAYIVSSCGRQVHDACLDGDGAASAGAGDFTNFEVLLSEPLAAFPDVGPGPAHSSFHSLMMVDGDGDPGNITQDDDFWIDSPNASDILTNLICPNAARDSVFRESADCNVLDSGGVALLDGDPATQMRYASNCFEGCGNPSMGRLTFRDLNGDGTWQSGEDLVVDRGPNGFGNGVFD